MPRGHGRIVVNADKVADRRSCAQSRRSSEQNSRKLPSKENQVIVPVLRNCEDRRIVLTFVTLDVHLWRLLVPFTAFIHGPELRNEQGAENPVDADMLDSHNSSYPQSTIMFDLQKEHSPSSYENSACSSASPKTVTDYKSSVSNVLGQPHRLKRNKSIRNTINNSLTTTAPKESSRLSYESDCIASNAKADATTKVDKPAKQSSRKKGKKKQKQNKRSMHKKVSTIPGNQGEEVNYDASKSETSACGDLVCSAASESNLSLVACPSLLVQDASSEVVEQRNIECNGKDCLGSLSSSVGEPLYKSINGSKKPVSLPYEFTDAVTDKKSFEVTSNSNPSVELSLSTSLQINHEIDMTESSPDDCGTKLSIANDGGFNPLDDRMTLISRNVSVQDDHEYSHQDNGLSSCCCISCSDWKKGVVDTDCSTERLFGSSQASSSDDFHDFHPVIRTKRGRLARKFSESSNGMHGLNNGHLHRYSEIENKHSRWKKVEKTSISELTCPRNNDKIASQHVDISLNCMDTTVRPKRISELKQNRSEKSLRHSSNEMNSSLSYSSVLSPIVETNSGHISMDGRSTCTYLEKLQKKLNLAAEQKTQSAQHTSINSSNTPKIQVLRRENLGNAVAYANISQLTDRSSSSLRTTKDSQNILQHATTSDNICSILHSTDLMIPEIPTNSLAIESNSGHSYADIQFHGNTQPSVDMNKDPWICTKKEGAQCVRVEMESAYLQSSRTINSSGTLLQTCVPTGRQDLVITRSQMDNQADSIVHEPVPGCLNSSFTDEFLSSNPHRFVCLSTTEIQCSSPSSGYMDCSSPEEDGLASKLDSQPCTSSEESSDFPSPSGFMFSHETKNQVVPGFETDLIKIIETVNGSYKLFVTTEGVQLATGSLHAGFERVLHSASPLIETGCISMCNTCSQNQIMGDSLCSHQVPNISLRRLWQWYEKPGSYGLEVKVEDLHTSKISRTGISKFCAYFVPYLSAVQLFARSGKPIYHPNNDTEGDPMKTSQVCKTSKYSTSLVSLPIFSNFLPQLSKNEDTGSTKLSSSGKSEEFNKPNFSEQLAGELLFEYFDSDQPQQRRPLFDKIQELIRDGSSSNCHFFGDPSKLGCLNLKELHPASWYSVAWYPIYRIPDGNFRAAFLTYHSFGRFIRRSTSNSIDDCMNSLILPVVGLQSYNAKGECWFEPTNLNSRAVQTDAAAFSESPSENFKGRLQSLERTAYVMSRATVRKGNLNCTNRHPDYEFFLSRKR